MSKPRKNQENFTSIAQIKEAYSNHPCMQRVNILKEQLKQEKLQDKLFSQSIKKINLNVES
ncbi:MAG: hypothetical protein AAFR62_12690 [Cyanobacteria bacterium J06629_2]